MIRNIRTALAFAILALALGFQPSLRAQVQQAKILATGTFHGNVHHTSGRATVYQEPNGKRVLRLTDFKTSNGPDVHVVLIAANKRRGRRGTFSRAERSASNSES